MSPLGPASLRRVAAKCCVACGRWGTRSFRIADSSDGHGEGWICENDRACKRRAEHERGNALPKEKS